MSANTAANILAMFNAWRRSGDKRTFEEIGFTPDELSSAILTAIAALKAKE